MRSAKGHMRQLGPGRWWVGKEGERDPKTGKRTQPGFVVRGSRVDAAVALATYLGEGLPNETTWTAFYEQRVRPSFDGLQPKTAAEYERLWNVELKWRIGEERVSDMDWHRANEVLTAIHSPTVQRSAGRFLKKMCNMAIRDRGHLLTVNPVDRAIEYAPHRRRPKRLVLSNEVHSFLDKVRGCPHEPIILCELGFGMRPEEARALLWEDLSRYELKGEAFCAAEIDKALTTVENRAYLKDTKNEHSCRTAVCGEPFASRLLELAEGKSGPLMPSGLPYDPENPEAWYQTPKKVAYDWMVWCKANGLDKITEANLRSSYASMMAEALVPDSIVAANMGHSRGGTKERHYQSTTMRAKCRAAGLLAASLADFSTEG